MKTKKYRKPIIKVTKITSTFLSSDSFNLLACACNDCYASIYCHGCLSGPASQNCNCDCD